MSDFTDYQSSETSWRYGARRSELQSRIDHVARAIRRTARGTGRAREDAAEIRAIQLERVTPG
jgi:hypothetical protein